MTARLKTQNKRQKTRNQNRNNNNNKKHSISMCNSPSIAFAWVGAILVNVGFISLITWGAATAWPLGFVLAGLYTLLLFCLARYLERRNVATTQNEHRVLNQEEEIENEERDTSEEDEPRVAPKTPVLVSLVYGLAVLSLGVTGFILPMNMFPDCNSSDYWKPQWKWTVNATSIPTSLRSWAKGINTDRGASFAYVADTNTTLFCGNYEKTPYGKYLLSTRHVGEPPKQIPDVSFPDSFTTLSSDTVCFQHAIAHKSYKQAITCSDGDNFRSVESQDGKDFVAHDGILWFKQYPKSNTASGIMIFSLDPDTMLITPHSHREKIHSKGSNDCNGTRQVRLQAIVTLLVVGLPIVVTSIGLWLHKGIPSMIVTAFVGLTIIFASIVTAITPTNPPRDPFNWWFAVTGLLLLSILPIIILKGDLAPPKYTDSLRWGLVIGGISFFSGMMALIFKDSRDELLSWILANLLVFIPLIVFGAATDALFLVVLGGIGFLMDSWRFADFVADHVHGQLQAPIRFLVFSITGLVVGAIGKCLSYFQPQVKASAERIVKESHFVGRMCTGTDHSENENDPLLSLNDSSGPSLTCA